MKALAATLIQKTALQWIHRSRHHKPDPSLQFQVIILSRRLCIARHELKSQTGAIEDDVAVAACEIEANQNYMAQALTRMEKTQEMMAQQLAAQTQLIESLTRKVAEAK